MSCHDLSAQCARCGGAGVPDGANPDDYPGCPLSPGFTFEAGPVGLQIAQAREKKASKERAAQVAPLRATVRMSQKTLAERAGIGRSMLAMIESGRALCSADMLERIKAAIKC